MNHQETLALLAALKSAGVSHFKSGDTDITLSATVAPTAPIFQTTGYASQTTPNYQGLQTQGYSASQSDPVVNEAATEKIKDLIETLKMDDASLLDKIFPAGAGG